MPYGQGGTLKGRLARGQLAPDGVRDFLAQIAEALDFTRQCGIVPRDVKPATLLLDGCAYLDRGPLPQLEGTRCWSHRETLAQRYRAEFPDIVYNAGW